MVDFLRSNPWCSMDEYLWRMTVGQVRLASFDFSHVEYLHDNKKKVKRIGAADDLKGFNDLGLPIK